MFAWLVLTVCLIAFAEAPRQQIPTDLEGDEVPLWEDYLEEDNKHHDIVSPTNADSFLPPSYEIVEVKPLSPGTTGHFDKLLYSITIQGEPLTMSLEKQIFLCSDFQAFIDDKVEIWLSKFTMSMGDCYFSGQLLEANGSSVTLRTCFGLRGLLEFGNGSFIIEPVQRTSDFLHMIYKIEATKGEPIFMFENDTDLNNDSYQQMLLKPFQADDKITASILGMRRYIKVSLFVTVEVFELLGASPKTVITTLLQVFSYVNTKFVPLKMEIFLSTIDLWTESNLCVIADSVSDTLENFIEWLSGLPSNIRSFNIPLLLVDGQYSGVGKTYFGKMCSNNNGAVLTFQKEWSLEKFSRIISHFLGHNVAMLHHHSGDCTCPAPPCIMDINMIMAASSRSFSDCSLMEFHNFIMKTGALCLLRHSNMKPRVAPSLCGDTVLDNGESCDCGTEAFLPYGTLCRKKVEECDLPEYCSGTKSACPQDVFQQNGNPCNDKKSICYDGKCQNVDLQCVQFFGPASRNADLECYQKLNIIGDRFGNCGGFKGFYSTCQRQDVLCGKLHCMIMDGEVNYRPDMAISHYHTSQDHICLSGDLLTDQFIDPLWVKDGTICGENKICINKKCTNISWSDSTCTREATCNGHGVCNNKHKCHCDPGWNPPSCNRTSGKQHSRSQKYDSGETSGKCSSRKVLYLINWLFVVFLTTLPLAIFIFMFCKRNLARKLPYKADEEAIPDSVGEQRDPIEMKTEVNK